MDAGEVLNIVDEMLENHIIPYIVYGVDMTRHCYIVFLDIDKFRWNIQLFETLAINIFILVHPFE